jgi:hypothetical protein
MKRTRKRKRVLQFLDQNLEDMVDFKVITLTDHLVVGLFILLQCFSVLCSDGDKDSSISKTWSFDLRQSSRRLTGRNYNVSRDDFTVHLDSYCRYTTSPNPIDLSCDKNAQGRAGTLQLDHYPTASCNFSVTVDGKACSNSKYALYLNFK